MWLDPILSAVGGGPRSTSPLAYAAFGIALLAIVLVAIWSWSSGRRGPR
jgi:hypothetical protein